MKKSEHLLKSEDVNLEGQFHFDPAKLAQTAQNAAKQQKNSPAVKMQAHIVENQPQFAIIEVTCSCGTKMHVKCEYPANQPDEQEQTETEGEQENAG